MISLVLQPHPLDLPPSMEQQEHQQQQQNQQHHQQQQQQQQQQGTIQDETNPQDSFDNMYIPGTASLIAELDSKKEVNE